MEFAGPRAEGGLRRQGWGVLTLALGALVVWGGVWEVRGHAAVGPRGTTGRVPLIYQNRRSFRIPFQVDAEGLARLKEVQLWVSEDFGYHWEPRSRTTPDLGKFTFRAGQDGEYWFATRTVTVDGRFAPPMDQTVEPSMKVVVDTVPPSLVLEPDGRRGSVAAVRWEVRDEHLDLSTLVLEYQVDGAREWRKVPIRRLALLGSQSWDAGTADALRVRASVSDKAGNSSEAEIVLPEGAAGPLDFADVEPEPSGAPPVEQISSGPGFPPVEEYPGGRGPAERGGPRSSLATRTRPTRGREPQSVVGPDWNRSANGNGDGGRFGGDPSPPFPGGRFPDPFPSSDPAVTGGSPGAFPGAPLGSSRAGGAASGATSPSMLVPGPRFKLQYAVDDAGPEGPAVVELWITQDGGRTWIRRGEDPDRVSPIEVDLGGEGTFGISLVARSAAGLGDQPPAPGDPPQTWVEVDSTPPVVQLYPPQIGTGPHAGKVAITWRASDLHLVDRQVALFWKPDQPGADWQLIVEGLETVGQYVWTVPPSVPPRFHLRVEAVDAAGHRGAAETTDAAPVIVDRSRPRSRIIGLDPNARAGTGPEARPLR